APRAETALRVQGDPPDGLSLQGARREARTLRWRRGDGSAEARVSTLRLPGSLREGSRGARGWRLPASRGASRRLVLGAVRASRMRRDIAEQVKTVGCQGVAAAHWIASPGDHEEKSVLRPTEVKDT